MAAIHIANRTKNANERAYGMLPLAPSFGINVDMRGRIDG
jgi:hypothetical protein